VERIRLDFSGIASFELSRSISGSVNLRWGNESSQLDWDVNQLDLPDWASSAFRDKTLEPPMGRNELMRVAKSAKIPFHEFRDAWQQIEFHARYGATRLPDWYTDFQERFAVLYITDQRLIEEPRTDVKTSKTSTLPASRAVTAASSEISERIKMLDSVYTISSQRLDKRFPAEVIQSIRDASEISLERLEFLEEEVAAQRGRLQSVGLLADDLELVSDIPAGSLSDPSIRPVLFSFWRTSLKKMSVLDDLSRQLIGFKLFLDNQFRDKSIVITRDEGINFQLSNREQISPAALSSGEQQMMILAYEILFKTEPGTLVVIDEPELSLHVSWQSSLLENLTEMGRTNSLQYLLATHSPTVLANQVWVQRSLDDVHAR
jgi:hypothetical protein